MRKQLTILGLLLVGCSDNSSPPTEPDLINTCTAILEWAPPIKNMDGTSLELEKLQKFTIYVNDAEGMEEARIILVIDLTDVYLIQWEIRNLPAGLHWFYMTATDTENNVSGFSNEKSKTCL